MLTWDEEVTPSSQTLFDSGLPKNRLVDSAPPTFQPPTLQASPAAKHIASAFVAPVSGVSRNCCAHAARQRVFARTRPNKMPGATENLLRNASMHCTAGIEPIHQFTLDNLTTPSVRSTTECLRSGRFRIHENGRRSIPMNRSMPNAGMKCSLLIDPRRK
jgi:hypothetical protein